jgi:cytochrome c-type biogenesis protein CcmH/NrfG
MQRISILIMVIYSLCACNSQSLKDPLNVNLKDTTLSKQILKLTKKINEDPTNHTYHCLFAQLVYQK